MSDAVAIGEQLRAARERLGVGVAQAAESMHVDRAVIEALESGRFFALGAPVFARGYLRHYADYLGEPLDEVTGRYKTLQEASVPPDLTAVPRFTGRPHASSRRRWPLVAGALALIAIVVIWWAMGVNSV
ncbi:MAG: helix-turn-helix domain-containing protein [Steroidobacteraceae bacterium]